MSPLAQKLLRLSYPKAWSHYQAEWVNAPDVSLSAEENKLEHLTILKPKIVPRKQLKGLFRAFYVN